MKGRGREVPGVTCMVIGRRTLLDGVGAIAALGLLEGTQASAARAPDGYRMLGNTAFPVPDGIIIDRDSDSLNSRKLCLADASAGIVELRAAYPGFGLGNPEQDLPSPYQVTAALEYPLGTPPRRLTFDGKASALVSPGPSTRRSDPIRVDIPPNAWFAIRNHVAWDGGPFWLSQWSATHLAGEWTERGRGLPDLTMSNANARTSSTVGGFGPIVYGTPDRPTPVVALIGDSIGQASADPPDPRTGHNGWGRAMLGRIPFVNLSRGGDGYQKYLIRDAGRRHVIQGAITHCVMQLGYNDLASRDPEDRLRSYLLRAIEPLLSQGVGCFATTFTPRTRSADGWLTQAGQSIYDPGVEVARRRYNDWLRAHARSVGLTGIFDLGHAVDPRDTGLWESDPDGIVPDVVGAGFASVAHGRLSGIMPARYNGATSGGRGYPRGATVRCVIQAYPETPGGGGMARAIIGGARDELESFELDNAGSGYEVPPMVASAGPFTSDGVHPNARGFNQMIAGAGIGPGVFVS
jgi:hypothetical protein